MAMMADPYMPNKSVKTRWKKVLYENTGLPDNYTHKSFLRGLQRNIDWKEVTKMEAITGSFVVVQELCVVVIVILVYVYLYNEWSEPEVVFYESSIGTVCGFLVHRLLNRTELKSMVNREFKTVLIFVIFGHLFSPILHTLTDTISTNTIYTMAFFMMLLHMIFADYGVSAAIVSNSLSLSAALSASVCLASRLPTAFHAFTLLTVAIECFVLFPFIRNTIRKQTWSTLLLVVAVTSVLASLSVLITYLFLSLVAIISVICPLLFHHYQRYKDNIYGPWDEAIINDADNLDDLIY